MPLLLRRSNDLPPPDHYDVWAATTGTAAALPAARQVPGIGKRLEDAFMLARPRWWELGRAMAAGRGGQWSHTAACGAFGSDFGLMLAWDRLARDFAAEDRRVLLVCDDPWLFRQLAAGRPDAAGTPPALAARRLRLAARGVLARVRLAVRLVLAGRATRAFAAAHRAGDTVLLVYGHPASNARGDDVYFGDLMRRVPSVKRLLHTDCPAPRAAELAADGRTASLHAWGSALFALLVLPWTRWRVPAAVARGDAAWLARRAAALENGGAGPAANRWQAHCQERWLRQVRPRLVAWPWENHGWERALCRAARGLGVATLGYQHTVIGPHQINYSVAANPDGVAAIPDLVAADGPAYGGEMRDWGVPAERMIDLGSLRILPMTTIRFDPQAPVFVPLSAVRDIALLQLEAARRVAAAGRRVLVKEHPMYPVSFDETANLSRTDVPLPRHPSLSAVLYSTGASGLEGRLAGVPTYRLVPDDRLAIDVLPAFVQAVSLTLDEVVEAIGRVSPPPPLNWNQVFSPADYALWQKLLDGDMDCPTAAPPQDRHSASA